MTTIDRTVGGIANLMGGHGNVNNPGAFDFVQQSEPVVRFAGGGIADFDGSNPDQSNQNLFNAIGASVPPQTPPAPDYGRIAQTYGSESPLSVYNLLRFGSERGGLQGVSPFAIGDIENWASQSNVLTPQQLQMARQGKQFATQEDLFKPPVAQTYAPPAPPTPFMPPAAGSTAIQPAADYTGQQNIPQPHGGLVQGQMPGSDFTVDDYYRIMGNQTPVTAQPSTFTPEQFKQYIYAGGADDAEATRRGIDWVTQQGMRPQDAVNLWNNALGTKFTVTDLFGQTGSGPEFTNFGDANSWMTGTHAANDPTTGMIKSSGAYFQKGNEAVVSDELFWNPGSPTGAELQKKVADAQNAGQRAGVVITPYAVFQGKATNEQLLNEIKNSGADFVALDPYLGWGVPADQLFDWTKSFIPQVNALGKEVKLVTQGFAKKGEEDAARSYNQQLLGLPGISEFVNFGLEDWFPEGSDDAKKLFDSSSEWTTLDNDYGKSAKQTNTGKESLAETPKLPASGSAAIQSAADYTGQQNIPQPPGGFVQGQMPGSDFTVDDYNRIMGNQTPATTQPSTFTPEQFKQYIYAGGADDAEATRRGIDWVTQQGMNPQEAVNLWNKALGTKFNATDFFKQTGQTPELTFFGQEGGWSLAPGAYGDPTRGRVYEPPSGVVFQRGKDVVVADEIFWSPYAATGDKLKNLVDTNKEKGYNAGVVVSPYTTFVGAKEGRGEKISPADLAAEVKRSGADFVAIDPYIGWFDLSEKQLFDWSKEFTGLMNDMGVRTILVMQNDLGPLDAKLSPEQIMDYNKKLMTIPGVSEFVAYSEAPESQRFTSLWNQIDKGKTSGDQTVATKEMEGRKDIGKVDNRSGSYSARMGQGIGSLV